MHPELLHIGPIVLPAYGAALGVSADRQAALEESVRDHMMQPLSRLANTEAVGKVAKSLGRN